MKLLRAVSGRTIPFASLLQNSLYRQTWWQTLMILERLPGFRKQYLPVRILSESSEPHGCLLTRAAGWVALRARPHFHSPMSLSVRLSTPDLMFGTLSERTPRTEIVAHERDNNAQPTSPSLSPMEMASVSFRKPQRSVMLDHCSAVACPWSVSIESGHNPSGEGRPSKPPLHC